MNKVLSISISAYNKAQYLDQCIQSLLIPSLDKLEIIVVNDGSTDHTSEIVHKYAAQYSDSIIAIDKPNGAYWLLCQCIIENSNRKVLQAFGCGRLFCD